MYTFLLGLFFFFNMHYIYITRTDWCNDLFGFSVRQFNCTVFSTEKQIPGKKREHATTESRTRSDSS